MARVSQENRKIEKLQGRGTLTARDRMNSSQFTHGPAPGHSGISHQSEASWGPGTPGPPKSPLRTLVHDRSWAQPAPGKAQSAVTDGPILLCLGTPPPPQG